MRRTGRLRRRCGSSYRGFCGRSASGMGLVTRLRCGAQAAHIFGRSRRRRGSPSPPGRSLEAHRLAAGRGSRRFRGRVESLREDEPEKNVRSRATDLEARHVRVEAHRAGSRLAAHVHRAWGRPTRRAWGWGRGGEARGQAPHGHGRSDSIAALLQRLDALVIDGPINGEIFLLYIEKILAPTLLPGDVVVLDSLGSQKGRAARAIVSRRGQLIFSPSPDSSIRRGRRSSPTPSRPRSQPVTSNRRRKRSKNSAISSVLPSAPTTSPTPAVVPSKCLSGDNLIDMNRL